MLKHTLILFAKLFRQMVIIFLGDKMKLVIIGSRTCPIEQYLKYIPDTIVSGGAKGVDTISCC